MATVTLLDFFVPGVPITQGSKSIVTNRRTGKPILIEQRTAELNGPNGWRTTVGNAARWTMRTREMYGGEDVALEVECIFTVPRPKSRPAKYLLPNKKPDLDKLTRAIGDALTKIVFADDGIITDSISRKRYPNVLGGAAEPGVQITIRVQVP